MPMTNVRLNEALNSDCVSVDGEHNLQLSLLGALRQAVLETRPTDEIDDLLERLVSFTKIHFASELTLMRLYHYPHFEAHLADHERTLDQLDALRDAWREQRVDIAGDCLDTLSDGLQSHIAGADAAFGRYLLRLGGAGTIDTAERRMQAGGDP